MIKNGKQSPAPLKLVIKSLAVFFLLCMFLMNLKAMIEIFDEDILHKDNAAYVVNVCNRYYYEHDYARLREYLWLYDAYDECFDVYWEIADGYSDYMQYKQWSATPENRVENSTEMAEFYRKKVSGNVENCKFEQNREILKNFAEAVYGSTE